MVSAAARTEDLVHGNSVIVGHGTVKLLLSRAGMWREISV
jgi:hypothetical protein